FVRVPQAVVDEAYMSAPALVALDLLRLMCAGRRLPEHLQVHIEVAQVSDGFPQFAGANAAIEVDHGRSFARRAPHRPAVGMIEVLKLCAVMKCESSDV